MSSSPQIAQNSSGKNAVFGNASRGVADLLRQRARKVDAAFDRRTQTQLTARPKYPQRAIA